MLVLIGGDKEPLLFAFKGPLLEGVVSFSNLLQTLTESPSEILRRNESLTQTATCRITGQDVTTHTSDDFKTEWSDDLDCDPTRGKESNSNSGDRAYPTNKCLLYISSQPHPEIEI